ncbi:alpha/beta fold hydrolase [Chitinophaga sp. CF418]|uniref:alpha/beta fold hydrolase n=1 Tax=Chitinophaga sp. CF418 TaxID=1855287 RepID=UPI00091ABEE5|nr:alpha/beta hydrolase [Chitinophaga sp. CF418]SHL96695.1 Pimeloyl-ACP methyl ester carboxylesterase [Chitinophaga sp. CF418]
MKISLPAPDYQRWSIRNGLLGSSLLVYLHLCLGGCNTADSNSVKHSPDIDTTVSKITAVNAPTKFAEVDGHKIAYRRIGQGEPLILCSRFRGNLDSWDPAFLDALAEEHTVVTFNYSGFGSSTGIPPTTMAGFAKDVLDLSASLGYDKFIIGGWSFGGAVAQNIITEHPEKVSQAILIGTRPPGKISHSFEESFLRVSRIPHNTLEDEVILFFEPAWEPSVEAARRSHDRIAQRKEMDARIDEKVWPDYIAGFADFTADPYKSREKLCNTRLPIMVISADHEVCFPPENWFELNRKLPTTQLVVIPRTGHGVHHEYPELVSQYITSFLRDRQRKLQ